MLPLLKTSGLTPENRVLEVGAGTGKRALEIAKFVEHGEVVGIDISESLLKSASENPANKNRKNLSFQSADIMSKESLSPLGKFDFVYIRLLLQHLNDPLMALENLQGILNPKGRIFIEDIDRDWMAVTPSSPEWAELYLKVKARQNERGGDPHVGPKLGPYLSKAGFTDVRVNLFSVCGENDQVAEWLTYYVPSFLNHLDAETAVQAGHIIEKMKFQCKKEPMFFYQTWFQAWGMKA